ncbi:MAG: helix-turn-helix domain-containing protein [Rhodospirillaceae bacterium]|nr:helix-turn-helix domain-containing protein [Rhodospirillaceae bacterium]
MRLRLDPEERRRRIIEAAVPLFAGKGFSGTTTKELAEAAGVSEGLLFRYFATKSALYGAILDHCRTANPEFERLHHLPPSTATLIAIVAYFVAYFADIGDSEPAEQARHRLFVRSLLEDGEFAAAGFAMFREAVLPMMERSLAAARADGDLGVAVPAETAFRLAAQLQAMIGTHALPPGGTSPRGATRGETIAEATRFILRGIGVKDAAIERLYRPDDAATERDAVELDLAS